MLTVAVTGASGQVGHDLVDVLEGRLPPGGLATCLAGGDPVGPGEFEIVALPRTALDVTDRAATLAELAAVEPDVVVHLAAFTAVDRAEQEPERASAVNVEGTRNVVEAARLSGAHVIALSTDYVFAGDLDRAMVESDVPAPLGVYGSTKLAAEALCDPGDTVVRTSWVAGARGGRGVIDLAVEAARDGRHLRFVADQVGSPTAAADLAAGLVAVIRTRPEGIVHLAGSGQASWHEVISFAVERAGGSPDQVVAIRTDQLDPPPLARRPAMAALRSERLDPLGFSALPAWQDGLGRLVDALVEERTP